MTAQIIDLAAARAEREPRRAVSLFEFWFLFWFEVVLARIPTPWHQDSCQL
jgi:hypothetical protein